jgi:capsid protein
MSSEFEAVRDNVYISDWVKNYQTLFPDDELTEDDSLNHLRQISNKLIKNNFFASTAQQAYVNAVIGGNIIVKVSSKSERAQKEIENIVNPFISGIDINRSMNISILSEQIINNKFANGDVLINLPMDSKGTYVELIEANRINTPPKQTENPLIREGVEYDIDGRLLGYHVIKYTGKQKLWSRYLTDEDYVFVPARNKGRLVALLDFAPINIKPLQSRQYPILTPIMTLLKYTSQYLEAVLIGARVSACFSAFVKTNNPAAAQKSLSGDTSIGTSISGSANKKSKLQPATISYLNLNEDILFASPNRPSDNSESFVLRLSRFIASALRFPYEHFFLDLSASSYSSWRGGSIEVTRNMNRWRRDLINVLTWILDTKINEAISKGEITSSLKNVKINIRLPKYKSIDEMKTAMANKIELVNGTDSIERISDEADIDYDELQNELIVEIKNKVDLEAERLVRIKEKSKELGIIFPEDKEKIDRITKKREGEKPDGELDDEEKKLRRKEDGNW